MAAPHSLPISNSQRAVTQLPFAPSSSSNGPPSIPGITSPSNTSLVSKPPIGSTPATPTKLSHHRTGSAVSSRSRGPITPTHYVAPDFPIGPSASMPILQPRPTQGTTHVGGILPSASFFHPTRPSYPPPSPTPPLPRPSTAGSVSSVGGTAADALRLAAIGGSYHRDRISEGTDSVGHSAEDVKSSTLTPSHRTASMKYSREPLLPIGAAPTTKSGGANRPTVQTNPYGRNEGAGGRMRDSFEKLFKRRFSLEGIRKSPTTPINPGASGAFGLQPRSAEISPVTFELNADGTDRSPTSPGHRKHSLSPLQGSSTSLNHASFIATPPAHMDPPLSAVPILDSRTGKPMRNYQLHPSRNRFFLGGRILTGGDTAWAFVASLTVVLSITGIWFGTTCVWWWLNESPAVAAVGAYMCLLSISSMLATAFRDPGILPRNLDPDPPYPASSSSESLRQPLPRDLKVRAGIVRTKFCPTCMTYRPPRSSHCKMCDNCVDGCDHHCQWVNNCVGRRNYTAFFTFLFSGVLTLVLVICTTAVHLYLLTRKYHLSFRQALGTSQGVGSAVAFCIAMVVIWPVLALLSYHLRLLLLNVTTIEQIRNQAHKSLVAGPAPPNPFSHGNWRRNLVYMLCRPAGYSWLDARAPATEDKREVNPGLLRADEDAAWAGDGAHGAQDVVGRGKGE